LKKEAGELSDMRINNAGTRMKNCRKKNFAKSATILATGIFLLTRVAVCHYFATCNSTVSGVGNELSQNRVTDCEKGRKYIRRKGKLCRIHSTEMYDKNNFLNWININTFVRSKGNYISKFSKRHEAISRFEVKLKLMSFLATDFPLHN